MSQQLPQTVTTAVELTRLLLGSLTPHSPPQPLAWRKSPSSLLEASTTRPVSGLSPNKSLHVLMLPLPGCGGGTFSSTLYSWFTSRNKGRRRLEKEHLGTCMSSSFSVLGNQGLALLLSVSGTYFLVPLMPCQFSTLPLNIRQGWTRAPVLRIPYLICQKVVRDTLQWPYELCPCSGVVPAVSKVTGCLNI